MLSVAKIVKPQGIKGELKLDCELDSPEMLRGFEEVFIGGEIYDVESFRISGGDAYVKLKQVNDRNSAEKLRGKSLEVPREKAPALPEGRFYIADLIGSEVVSDSGENFGKLKNVLQYGSADVYVISGGKGKEISFPALKKVLNKVDTDAKIITVKAEEFEKVAVYED